MTIDMILYRQVVWKNHIKTMKLKMLIKNHIILDRNHFNYRQVVWETTSNKTLNMLTKNI